ncbi:MAG: outer membrane beta-barrel protein [Gallionellaceae bacterium]|nr:outer membrane beta-barrel protein [Gallionellaceae bacterium]
MKKVVFLAAAFLGSASALAQDRYVSLDYGNVSMSNNGASSVPQSAYRLGLGYKNKGSESLNTYTELSYMSIGDSNYSDNTGSFTTKTSSLQLSALFAAPVTSDFSVLARLGVGFNYGKSTGTGGYSTQGSSANRTEFIYGIGVRYSLSEKWSVDAQYEYLGKFAASSTASGVDVSTTTVGLKYNY